MNYIKLAITAALLIQSSNQHACIGNLYHRFLHWWHSAQVLPSNAIELQKHDDTHITFTTQQPYSAKVIAHLFTQAINYAAHYPTADYYITTGKIGSNRTRNQAEVHLELLNATSTTNNNAAIPDQKAILQQLPAEAQSQADDTSTIERIIAAADDLIARFNKNNITYRITTESGVHKGIYNLQIDLESAQPINDSAVEKQG